MNSSFGCNFGGIKNPCKGCERREVGCHSKCEDYSEFLKLHEEWKAKRDKKKEIDKMISLHKERTIPKGKLKGRVER